MRVIINIFLMTLLLCLSGCGDNGINDLKLWMDNVKKETVVSVPSVSEPKVFVPVAYDGTNLVDPFDPSKLLIVFARMKDANDNGLKPNFDRPKEALEAYSLDTMSMVGTIESKGVIKALIRVGVTTFAITKGAFIGQNFGRIVAVTDSKVDLIETVQDASGEWVERKATLEKQEAK
jgi:type IV pilus assembly protein PilP